MKDLRELGFGPPDLGLPKGRCENGHLWADNVSINRYGDRTCGACNRAARKLNFNRKKAKKTGMG